MNFVIGCYIGLAHGLVQREHGGRPQEPELHHGAPLQAGDERHREAGGLHQQVERKGVLCFPLTVPCQGWCCQLGLQPQLAGPSQGEGQVRPGAAGEESRAGGLVHQAKRAFS